MGNDSFGKDKFINFREHASSVFRSRFPARFPEKASHAGSARTALVLGVVYDVSMKGARVSSEASIKPGDQVMVTLQLPKQLAPVAVERATVRWAKEQTFGLEFMHLTFTGALQLKRFISLHAIPSV